MKRGFVIFAFLIFMPWTAFAQPVDTVTIEEPSPQTRALAGAAWVFPGVLLHGSGAFVMGDTETATALAIGGGAGVGLGAVSAAAIWFSGASAQILVPAIGASVFAMGLFATTLLADLYAVTAPEGGFGSAPDSLDWLNLRTGVTTVSNPVFGLQNYGQFGAQLNLDDWRVDAVALVSGEGQHQVETEATWRFLGRARDELNGDGSFLGLRLGHLNDATVEGTAANVFRFEAVSRVDGKRVGRLLDGSFFEFSLGYGLGWDTYVDEEVREFNSLLLGRFAYGLYLGDGGELALFYDHDHESFAGGLKLDGVASGLFGHVGLSARIPVYDAVDLYGEFAVGSAAVGTLGVSYGW